MCSQKLPVYTEHYDFIFRDLLALTLISKVDYITLEKETEKNL